MTDRTWDPEGKYKEGFLKEYNHWVLEVSFRQHTLGCYFIFCKRAIEKISELQKEELLELRRVMEEIEAVLSSSEAFKPDRFNYLQLGNALHHLHFHGIPRYKTQREFEGKIWNDASWGHPPVWTKEEVDLKIVHAIKRELQKELD